MTEALQQLLARQRDPQRVAKVVRRIAELCAEPRLAERQLILMEVCGTHTMSVHRYGLKKLLPPNVRLVSGPGCPVCVTPAPLLAQALALSQRKDIIITSFGDMLRVPLAGNTLLKERDAGAQVRLVTSPLEALALAEQERGRQVVFLAVGFETTAPLTAATLQMAAERGVDNFSILCAHRTMPQALRALLPHSPSISGLLCPGHVSAVTGAAYFEFVPAELGKPAVVAGFEPLSIMEGILLLLQQCAAGESSLQNAYAQVVPQHLGSPAWQVLCQVFEPEDSLWRGLGLIEDSGLKLRQEYAAYDAVYRFDLAQITAEENPACHCGEVLAGRIQPLDCPLFGSACTPDNPDGACMVSSEGACAAMYRYN